MNISTSLPHTIPLQGQAGSFIPSDEKSTQNVEGGSDKNNTEKPSSNKVNELEEQKELTQLKSRDREVRAHEQAHISAGGSVVNGGASFSYTTGPDGKRYAVGGEVSVDTSKASSPEATIIKAGQIQRAALAPAQPSSQDRTIAAQAAQMKLEAQQEIQIQSSKAMSGSSAQTQIYQFNQGIQNGSASEPGQYLSLEV